MAAQNLVQAYRQAPWRNQLVWVATILLGVTVLALIAGLYLSISAQAVTIGTEIQKKNAIKYDTEQNIADLRNQLADLTSSKVMEQRAREMGFEYLAPADISYIVIPGYAGRQTPLLAARSTKDQAVTSNPNLILPSYRQSLSEFLYQGIIIFSDYQGRSYNAK
jgi:hypothetical protein